MSKSELSVSQAAWNEFTEQLQRIGEKIVGPTGARSARERAEGYRYLVRLLSAGHQLEMEIDRRHPSLTRMMWPIRKFKGDGTDTLDHEAKLDESLSYLFTVRRGEDVFFSATVYAHDERDAYHIVDDLCDEELVWEEEDGVPVARIHLSAERPEGAANWIRLAARKPILFTRQYFPEFVHTTDVAKYRPAVFDITCTDDVPAPAPLDEQALADGLQRLTDFIEDATDVSIGLSIFAGLNLISHEKTEKGQTVDVTQITDGRMHLDDERHDWAAELADAGIVVIKSEAL